MESPNPFSREAFLTPSSSQEPLKKQRSRRSKRLFAGAIGVAILGIGASFLFLYLVREHRRNPYATMQNGLILRAIHTSDYEPFHKNPDSITYESHYPTIEVELPRGARLQSVTGRASTGDAVLLDIAGRSTLPANPFDLILGDRQSVTINLPQFGVPASFKWVDVSIEDSQKRRGTWRVYGLPSLKHILPPGTPLLERYKANDIAVTAQASWYAIPGAKNGEETPIKAEVKAVVPASARLQPNEVWGMDIQSITPEWTSSVPTSPRGFETEPRSIGEKRGPLTGLGVLSASAVTNDCSKSPSVQHLARINARLVRYDVAMETVAFRNLPLKPYGNSQKIVPPLRDLSLRTQSGVRVALIDPGPSPNEASKRTARDVAVFYSIYAPTSANTFPQNVQFASAILSEKNQGVRVENHYSFNDWIEDGPNSGVFLAGMNSCYLLNSKNVSQSFLSTLTISVARQTERESIPITFVVPIQKSQPTEVRGTN